MPNISSPNFIRKEHFTLHEIADIIGESVSCINYWRKAFKILSWRSKSFNGCWKFTRTSVAKFHLIKNLLRNEKYTIEEAKQKLLNHGK